MTEIRREDDGELLGFVTPGDDGGWRALAVFGAELATTADRDAAVAAVEAAGLAVLAETWWYADGGEWVPARIREAGPGRVTAVIGILPDTPRPVTLTGPDAAALRRHPASSEVMEAADLPFPAVPRQ